MTLTYDNASAIPAGIRLMVLALDGTTYIESGFAG
jgi:hypothetical protein